MMNVKEKIYAIKDKKKITLVEIANRSGLSRDAIMRWDVNSPSVANLKKVADVLEVPIEELIGD